MAYDVDQYIIKQSNATKSLRDGILLLMQTCTATPSSSYVDATLLANVIVTATGVDCSSIIQKWLQPYRL
jgi:hypothetical protein